MIIMRLPHDAPQPGRNRRFPRSVRKAHRTLPVRPHFATDLSGALRPDSPPGKPTHVSIVRKRGRCWPSALKIEDKIMRKALIAGAMVTAMALSTTSTPVEARGGRVAAGLIGGLAVGTLLGAAVAQPRYYGPPPVYVEGPPPRCYWTRGEPVWDPYIGAWRRPRMQICD
jgi:hypothetical protein